MIGMYIAPSGYGKSVAMMQAAIMRHGRWRKRQICTNMEMAIPHTKVSTIEELMQVNNADVYIDEFDTVFGDPRESNKTANRIANIAAKVARKKDVSLFGSIQVRTMGDLRLRANTDIEFNPTILNWVNMKTGEDMAGPLTFAMQEMVEMSRDEAGKKIWQPGLVEVISKKMSGDIIVHAERDVFSCQEPIYRGRKVLDCYDSTQLILKKEADNDALVKAVALESILTKKLRTDMWGYNILQMPQSGFHMSYSTTWLTYACPDIILTHPNGHSVLLDVVGAMKDSGYDAIRTAHKDWEIIENSIKMHGPLADGYLAFFYNDTWFFSKIDIESPAFRTKHTGSLKKSNIHISKILSQSVEYEKWIDMVRDEGEQRVSNVYASALGFASAGTGRAPV